MFVVDTNILVYGADGGFREHETCRKLLLGWRTQNSPWYLTWGILYEFLRVTTHPSILKRPLKSAEAWQYLQAILLAPTLRMLVETERHKNVMEEVFRELPRLSGNLLLDAHTAVLMREHGVRRVVTHDADFHRFPFLEVVDPLQ